MLTVVLHHSLASEAQPEDYSFYPDPIEHANGLEKKMFLARRARDDRDEAKVYYRAEKPTKGRRYLVPFHLPTDVPKLNSLLLGLDRPFPKSFEDGVKFSNT
ncbi:hypothetical protein TELCIR_10971 [Teladorsagia circumcincta]|uniref:Uncharacterized protein n=1 Tax=Teladorsagia circumcincta TaxID=45464 RepID=A0A2G9UAR1_TELCI|nr:hypothetical protein TELCIR_10971 [Teladorsagia circumcincta]